MSKGFWPQVFDLLADEQGQLPSDALSDDNLVAIRKRIRAGELTPPVGEFTTDPKVALNRLNRWECQRAFIAYRRSLHGYAIRAFIPLLSDSADGRGWGPMEAAPWVRTIDDPDAARRHAKTRLTGEITAAIRLHGPMLLQSGLTVRQLELEALAAVTTACAALKPPTAKGAAA